MSGPALDIAIPVLNEERRLRRGVEETLAFCKREGIDAVVTIADNGSTDRTREVAKRLAAGDPRVRWVSVGRRGVGLALKKAWSGSDREVVGYMDVDLATDLRHLVEVAAAFRAEPGDLVVTGSRLIPGAAVTGRSLLREATSRGFNRILRAALGVGFTDGMCGFKFLRKRSFDALLACGIDSDEWFFNTELLVKAEWAGFSVREIPVRWTDDGDSRVRLVETILKYLREIRRLRRLRGGKASRA